MNTVKDMEIRYYKPLADGFTLLSNDGGADLGFFCTLRALKEYARFSGIIVKKAKWYHLAGAR